MKCLLDGPCPYEINGECTREEAYQCEMQEDYIDEFLEIGS